MSTTDTKEHRETFPTTGKEPPKTYVVNADGEARPDASKPEELEKYGGAAYRAEGVKRGRRILLALLVVGLIVLAILGMAYEAPPS